MNRSVIIALSATALLLLLLFALMGGSGDQFNWRENYKSGNKQPYGTYIIHEMLDDYYPNKDFKVIKKSVTDDLPPHPEGGANYVFIGEAPYLDSMDRETLLEFIANGNNAFISSKSIPHDLMFYVYYTECNGYLPWNDYKLIQDTLVNLNFFHQNLETEQGFDYQFSRKHKTTGYQWNHIDSAYFCEMELGFTELGSMEDMAGNRYYNFAMVNFMDIEDYSKPGGKIFFHTNPLAFTNYHMVDSTAKRYADRIFSHLPEGDIYWDSYSQVKEAFSRSVNRRTSQDPTMSLSNETPLKYILGNRHLSWAWYTLLGLGALYLMFRAKRRQRIIPVKDQNSNTSLEFISTIGGLYYKNKNNRKLCEQKMKIFLAHMRNRYAVSTKRLDEKFIRILSQRSAVPEANIKEIVKYYDNIKRSTFISNETLKSFHKEMEGVYKLCK